MRRGVLLILGALCLAPALPAQSPADSANIVLDAARTLAREGHAEAARQLFLLIRARYGTTAAARVADSILATLTRTAPTRSGSIGRTGFILFHTLYGGFLGAAIPAAFGADGSEPYGAGLLIGAPLGYFGSRAFARARITMPGQAGIASFATAWGTWQGLALQQMLDLGDKQTCNEFGCFTDESDTAPWAAMVVGGLAGLGTGFALASRPIQGGTSTLISHSAFWGSWFGLSLGRAFGAEGDALIATSVIGGDAALLAAIPAAGAWKPSSGRVRLTTAAGIAGGLAGFGVDLLASVDDERVSFAIPAATSALGLIVGALATRNQRDADEDEAPSGALLTLRDRARLNVPLPFPAVLPSDERGRRWRPGMRLLVFYAEF
jgi:hypothetical protein